MSTLLVLENFSLFPNITFMALGILSEVQGPRSSVTSDSSETTDGVLYNAKCYQKSKNDLGGQISERGWNLLNWSLSVADD